MLIKQLGILILSTFFVGCTSTSMRLYSGTEKPIDQISIVQGGLSMGLLSTKSVGVTSLDGQKIVGHWTEPPYQVQVLPGVHTITVRMEIRQGNGSPSRCPVELSDCLLLPGKSYGIHFEHVPPPLDVQVSIKESSSEERVCANRVHCR